MSDDTQITELLERKLEGSCVDLMAQDSLGGSDLADIIHWKQSIAPL